MNHALNEETRRRMSKMATIAALSVALIGGLALIGVSIWGFWICQSLASPFDDHSLAAFKLGPLAMKFWLSWLVLFFPFACVGAILLRSIFRQAFGKQDESWIYPFRVFMAVVGMRIAAESQTKGKILQP